MKVNKEKDETLLRLTGTDQQTNTGNKTSIKLELMSSLGTHFFAF